MDFDLTAIMERDGIKKIERVAGRYVVLLMDGRIGIGGTVGEALTKANRAGAENVLKVAA